MGKRAQRAEFMDGAGTRAKGGEEKQDGRKGRNNDEDNERGDDERNR